MFLAMPAKALIRTAVVVSTGALQEGTTMGFNVSSGTVNNLHVSTITINGRTLRYPFIDLKNFGAKCDGTTNDHDAIQNAITSLTGGGTILVSGMCGIKGTDVGAAFNNGVYLTVSSITIIGANNQTDGFVWVSTKPGNMFRGVGDNVGDGIYTNGVTFRNLKLQGDPTRQDMSSGSSTPFYIHKFNDFTVENCVIRGFSGLGAYVGVSSGELSKRLTFVYNYMDGAGVVPMAGIFMYNVDGFDISHNHFVSISRPVYLESTSSSAGTKLNNGTVSHNIVSSGTVCSYANTNSFIAFGAQISAGNESVNVVFDSNVVNASSGSTGTNVSGAFLFIGANADRGNANHITVSNNIFNRYTPTSGGVLDFGIYLSDVDNFTVVGNILGNPVGAGGQYGIYLDDARYSLVANNSIDGTNWSQSIQEIATIECRNDIHGNHTTNDSGATFGDFATSKSNINHQNLNTNRNQLWHNGFNIWRMEAGDFYDRNGNEFAAPVYDINIITTISPSTGTIGFTSAWVMYVSTGSSANQQWVKIGSQ